MIKKDILCNMFDDQPTKYRFKRLRVLVIAHIIKLVKHLTDNEFDKASDMLSFSSSGDGCGDDNHYLSFDFLGIPGVNDIGDVIRQLNKLYDNEMQ